MYTVLLFGALLVSLFIIAGAFLILLGIKNFGERSAPTWYSPLLISAGGAIWVTTIIGLIVYFHL